MPRPSVQIYQKVLNTVVTPADPDLATCIVGPAYDFREYPEDKLLDSSNSHLGPHPDTPWANVAIADIGDRGFSQGGTEMEVPLAFPAGGQNFSLTDFGYVASQHTIHEHAAADAERPQVYLEQAYVEIVTAANMGNDLVINADKHTLEQGGAVDNARNWQSLEAGTYADKAIKKGDIAVIAPLMAQVFYDPTDGIDFLVSQPKSIKILTDQDGLENETFDVLKIIDSNRLLLTERGQKLENIAGAATGAALAYSLHSVARGAIAAENIIGVAQAAQALIVRPAPEAIPVQSVNPDTFKLVLARDILWQSAATKRIAVRIERKLSDFSASQPGYLVAEERFDRTDTSHNVATHGVLQIATVPTVSFGAGNLKVTRARAYITWRGLRTSVSDIKTVGSVPASGEFADIGRVGPKNPLALATAVCLDNAGATNIKVLPTVSAGNAGFTAARPKLNSAEDVYCIVPLSTDLTNVILPLKNDAVDLSDPDKSQFRIVIGASEGIPLVNALASGSESGTMATANLSDASADFLAAGIAVNDKVVWDTDHTFYVHEVINAQNLSIKDKPEDLVADGGSAALINVSEADRSYAISRDISTDSAAQVALLKARLTSVADKRLTMVYPGTCTARGYAGQPGYYLSAALGGVVAGTNPHRPKNQLGIAGIDQIFNSNLKFSDDEIDALGDGGYFVFVQDSISGAPYTPHQVTTGQIASPGVQEFSELSVVTNFDFVSKIFKVRMDPYVGIWNVIPEALESIRGSLEGGISDLASRSAPRIGAPLISGSVSTVAKDASDSGRINVSVEVQLPKVLNKLVVYLTSV